MNLPHAIALTGGIASGKSTVAKILEADGFKVIDLDIIAHELLDLHAKEIGKIFGDRYVKDSKVDRKTLGDLIFNDKNAKEKLENFLHPFIKNDAIKKAKKLELNKKPYFIDNPLFFETNDYDIKPVVLVYAPKQTQLQRLMKRSNLTEHDALKRIEAQMDIESKKKMADFIIDNSTELMNLNEQIQTLYSWIKEGYASSKI